MSRIAPVLASLATFALVACGPQEAAYEQVLVFNNESEPETLDPHLMTGVPEHNLALALFEGLTTHDPKTLAPLPGVAERWEVSPDATVYTFHLRADAKWSNGDSVTAEDFRWSWQRALSPTTASYYADMLYSIRGAEAFNKAETKDFATVGVEVQGPRTLRVTLRAPTAFFLDLTCFETLMPVHRATVEKHGSAWTGPANIVSNGPFRLSAWRPRDAIEMVPNEHYWDRATVRLERIVAKPIDDQNTALNEYLSGGLDWIKSIPAQRVEEAQKHPDYYVQPYLGTYFFRFNCTKPPFDDARVRRAFNVAINKTEICEKTLKAGQKPATGMVPPFIAGYPEFKGDTYDPARAKQLLAEAGYPGGEGFPEVEVRYNTSESHKQVCEVMSSMWRENLGVNVKLKNLEWQVYLEDTRNLRYQIVRAGWIGDYSDPFTFLDLWVKDRGNNNTGWSNATYDDLISRASMEIDAAKRVALYQEAERILCVDEVPVMPVYYYVNQGMLRPRVKGWHENVRDLHPFQHIRLDGPPPSRRD